VGVVLRAGRHGHPALAPQQQQIPRLLVVALRAGRQVVQLWAVGRVGQAAVQAEEQVRQQLGDVAGGAASHQPGQLLLL
jgi:hypothetical protein